MAVGHLFWRGSYPPLRLVELKDSEFKLRDDSP